MNRSHRRLSAFLLAACSCALGSAAPPITVEPLVARPLVHSVYASSQMAPDCKLAVALAVGQIQSLGVPLKLAFVPLEHRVFWLEPSVGEIAIRADFGMASPNAKAVPYVWLASDGSVERAELVVLDCSPEVVLHHLAHATDQVERIDYERVLHARESVWGHDPIERR